MNIFSSTDLLRHYAERSDWEDASPALCHRVLRQILADGPAAECWHALLELLAIWPVATDVQSWVEEIEAQVAGWPWRIRECILGHRATRGDKQIAYRLIGRLIIDKIEDLYGNKFKQWAQNENWLNLRGLSLVNVETEPKYLAFLTGSPYLQGIVSLKLKTLDSLSGGIDVMFGNNQLPNLRELALISVELVGDDIDALRQVSFAKHLSSLNLSGNYLNSTDLPRLFDPETFANLQTLNLSQMTITADSLQTELENAAHAKLEKVIIAGTPAARDLGIDVITPSTTAD
jgi:hypothetical protein